MLLNDLLSGDIGKQFVKASRAATTYTAFYKFWRDNLFERVMRLFVWEGTGDVPPKEIEQRLILLGYCGITELPEIGEGLTAVYGSLFGPTKYEDEKTSFTYRTPLTSGTRKIGDDLILINANSLRTPVYEIIHHYAALLAHTEVTYVHSMINARDAGGVPVVTTEKQRQSVADYQAKIYDGKLGAVADIGALGLSYAGTDRRTGMGAGELLEARGKLLKAFYSDIGVRSAFEKRSNAVVEEVEADTSLLLLNISDMLKCRQDGAAAVNAKYGASWSVHVAEEIDYGAENEEKEVQDDEKDVER